METVTVRGVEVPAVGLGTSRLAGEECRRVVEAALDLGYRHLDTARGHGNEAAVGTALAAADVDRDDVFLTTTVPTADARRGAVLEAAAASTDALGVDAVDLLLLDWPDPRIDVAGTAAGLAAVVEAGLARHVGVANAGRERLAALRSAADVPLLADQVQLHPYRPKADLLEYCRAADLLLTADSPLAHGGLLRDETLRAVARRRDRTPAQVALRWALQHDNVAAVPTASSREHLAENLDVFDFSLTDEEMGTLTRPSLVQTGIAWLRGHLGV